MFSLAAFVAARPAVAQLYDDARRAVAFAPDPIARSPRLLGMGRLVYLLDDPQNRISLWDFAGNPTGLMEDDSTSIIEFMPATAATSSVSDIPGPDRMRERQTLAAREVSFGYEAWHRARDGATYGAIGDLGLLRTDRPFSADLERRVRFTVPRIMPVINGRMPYLLTERLVYAVRFIYQYESADDRLRTIVRNPAGDYIDLDGITVPDVDFFTPNQHSVRTLGGGAALSYRFGSTTVAVGHDQIGSLVKGRNEASRYLSETRENRPYGVWQGTAVGHIGGLEWGADAQSWKANSKASWVFSISTGSASTPLAGRGSLYRRSEEGRSLRGRARWKLGSFELGGGGGFERREIDIVAPLATDSTSFNRFRNFVFLVPSADSLYLPDSVTSNRFEQQAWTAGGGIGWTRADGRWMAAAEFHRSSAEVDAVLSGRGPNPASWDLRTGVECAVNPTLRLRAGYIHRWTDRDELTANSEFLANAGTIGLGIAPSAVRWSIEGGYIHEWERADFGDPGSPRTNRNQLAVRVTWPL
jgi:hypothetical protein